MNLMVLQMLLYLDENHFSHTCVEPDDIPFVNILPMRVSLLVLNYGTSPSNWLDKVHEESIEDDSKRHGDTN